MKKDEDINLLKERVNLRLVLTTGGIALIGVALLCISSIISNTIISNLVLNLGGLVFVTMAITIIWELFGKRSFMDEILAKAQISKEVAFAKLIQITDSFHDENLNWKAYFKSVTKLDMFFSYAQSWRNTHHSELNNLSKKYGARIRVILPDPESKITMEELAKRYGYSVVKLVDLIAEARGHFERLKKVADENNATVELWYLPSPPLYSYYRFNDIAIFALYNHSKDRTPVPTFVCERGGTLYDFVRTEFDSMLKNGLARKIF